MYAHTHAIGIQFSTIEDLFNDGKAIENGSRNFFSAALLSFISTFYAMMD